MNNFNAEYAAVLSTRIEREMFSLPNPRCQTSCRLGI